MTFLKSMIPGFLLSFIVSTVIGAQRSTGGFLNIHQLHYHSHSMYWSWPLFIGGTLLAYAIFKSME
jgi:hypothetical protein